MVAAGIPPLLVGRGVSVKFRFLAPGGSILLAKRLRGLHRRSNIARPIEGGAIPLYEFAPGMGGFPGYDGAALRPQWPPSDDYARAPCFFRASLGGERMASGERIRKIGRLSSISPLELGNCPAALKVSAERANPALGRARRRLRSPTQRITKRMPANIRPSRRGGGWLGARPIGFRTLRMPITGRPSLPKYLRLVSLGPNPLRNGCPRNWRAPERPGVAEDLRRARAVAVDVSTLTTPTPGSDSELIWPSGISRSGYQGGRITSRSDC